MVSFSPVETGLLVQFGEVVVGPEGAVLVGGLAPRHVDGAGDVAGTLALLLRQVRGARILPENSSGLRTSTRFLTPMAAMVSSRKARIELSDRRRRCTGGGAGHGVGRQGRPSIEFHFAATVEQLDVLVAVRA